MRPSAGQAVQNHAQHHNADTQKSHRPGQRIPEEEDGSMSIVVNNGKDVILSDDILAVWAAFAKGVNVRKFVIKEVLNKSSAAG